MARKKGFLRDWWFQLINDENYPFYYSPNVDDLLQFYSPNECLDVLNRFKAMNVDSFCFEMSHHHLFLHRK